MAMTINTNVVSINAQRNLGLSGGSLSTTMQRLSSGLRVNSAKDDAAGLAIAERMNAQSKGLAIAARNANDGISLAQTTEGALGKIGDMLQRMRELAVQSSNATNSESDRAALQAELSQLTSEIDRVAKTTSFNGTKVLDGSFTGGVFQVGSNAGDNITIQGTTKATGDGLGNVKFGSTKSVEIDASKITGTDQPMEKGTLSIQVGNGAAVELSALKAAASGEERLGQMVAAINEKTADTGVTAFLSKEASGNYTIALKSESAEPVTLKGFESLAGEAGKLDTTAIAADIAAFKSTPVGTAADAKAVVTAFETALPSATGYDAGGNHTVGSVAAKAAAAIVSLKANYNAAGDAWETNKDAGTFNDVLAAVDADVLALVNPEDRAALNTTAPSDATAAEELVGKLEAFKATVDGYVAGGTSTGSAAQIDTAIAAIQAEIKTPTGAGNVFDAAVVGAALAKLTPDTWTALPAASGATDTDAYKAAMKLDSTATAASFNQALTDLKDPTKGNWTGVQTQALDVTTATAEDVTAAVTALQKELDTLGLNISGAEVKTNKGIADVNITTQAGAWEAIKQIDSAIDQVNKARGDLGALQTRFEKTVENIDIQNENISAAKGRIVDADFATETANLSRAQILQQAGTAMVAQANQLPQNVLSLLR